MSKRNWFIIGFSLILLGILLLVVGLFYPEFSSFSEEKLILLSEEEAQKEYQKFYPTLEKTLLYCNSYLLEQYPISQFDKLSSQDKTLFLLNILNSSSETDLTKKKIEKEKLNYFDKDTILYFNTITQKDGKVLYQYDDKKEQFIYHHYPATEYHMLSKGISSKIYTTQWVIKRRAYYVEKKATGQEYPKRVFKSRTDVKNKKNEIFTVYDNEHLFTNAEYQKVEKQLEIITYTFKKIEGQYRLVSIRSNR